MDDNVLTFYICASFTVFVTFSKDFHNLGSDFPVKKMLFIAILMQSYFFMMQNIS